MSFAQILKQQKELYNLSNVKIADICSVSEGAVRSWLNEEKEPTISKIVLLSEKLNVTTDYLLTGKIPVVPASVNIGDNNNAIGVLNHAPITITTQHKDAIEETPHKLSELEQEILNIYNNLSASEKLQFFHEIYKFRKDVI